jgi:hypothetical protein
MRGGNDGQTRGRNWRGEIRGRTVLKVDMFFEMMMRRMTYYGRFPAAEPFCLPVKARESGSGHFPSSPSQPVHAMFEARLAQGSVLKKLIESIRELVTDANFDVTSSGLALQVPPRRPLHLNRSCELQPSDQRAAALAPSPARAERELLGGTILHHCQNILGTPLCSMSLRICSR